MAGEHHQIELAPAHQPRYKAAREQQRADIGDQRGQIQPGVGERAAWFKDSEGNLLAIGQPTLGP